jgi:hypothetical protein
MQYPKEQFRHKWWEDKQFVDPKRKGLYPGQYDNQVVEDEDDEVCTA